MSNDTIREILFDEAEEFAPSDFTEPNYTNYIEKIDRKIERTKSQIPYYLSKNDYDLALALLVASDLTDKSSNQSENSGKLKSVKIGDEQITYSEENSKVQSSYLSRYERILGLYPQIGVAYLLGDF